jgi:putative phage-type endonuclease
MSIASGTTITPDNHAEWLAMRPDSVGASESATVLGLNPWESQLQLYLLKIGSMPPAGENQRMKVGKLMEPVIAALYREETGCEFACFQRFLRSPSHQWMTATLDGVRTDGRVVELKNVGVGQADKWGESGSDDVPLMYIIQATHQMVCSGTDVLDVAALIGGWDFRWYSIPRDDRVADRIVEATGEFMDRVQRRDPPPVDPARDGAALARLWPRAEGEVELGPVGELLVESWEAHGRAIREHEAARDRVKTELLCHLGEAASARLADGRILTRRVVEVAEKQVTRRGYSFVDLRLKKGS